MSAARKFTITVSLGLIVARSLWACGGDDVQENDVDASTDGTTGDTSTDSSNGGDGSNRDTGSVSDSGIDTGEIALHCGAITCDLPAQICCVPLPGFSDSGIYCASSVQEAGVYSCKDNTLPFACLDSTQCSAGTTCFALDWFDAEAPFSGCETAAAIDASGLASLYTTFCRNASDCSDGAPCTSYECFGNDISACGTLDPVKFEGCTPR